jgi:hypothetical protein
MGIPHDVDSLGSHDDAVTVLTLSAPCPALSEAVTLHLMVRDADDLRGALKPDKRGQTWRGDIPSVQRLLLGGTGGAA